LIQDRSEPTTTPGQCDDITKAGHGHDDRHSRKQNLQKDCEIKVKTGLQYTVRELLLKMKVFGGSMT
jgi:hypothetical protein